MTYTTDQYEGLLAETITVSGANGDAIHAYFARPLGPGPFPAVLLIHHLPGWDEFYRETARRYAHHGYLCLSPDLYCRAGHGAPDDVTAKVRAEGGVPDDQVVADAQGCIDLLRAHPAHNGKVGVTGTCSGGRHTVLIASRATGVDAAVDCWGGRVVQAPGDRPPAQPVAPIDYTADLQCPLLGLFGEDDSAPSPAQVAEHEAAPQGARQDLRVPHVPRRRPRLLLLRPPGRLSRHGPPSTLGARSGTSSGDT